MEKEIEAKKPGAQAVLWRVRHLSVSFLLIFFAYSSAQLLESTLNGSSGYLCLSLIYGFLSVSFLCAPYIVSLFAQKEATFPTLFFYAALPYIFMVSTKLLPAGLPGRALISQLSCAGVGIGGGPLWSAQGFYIARATAATLAFDSSSTLSTVSTRLNSAFYSTWMLSGLISNSVSTLVMLSFADATQAVFALFALLTAVGVCGLLAFTTLPMPDAPGQAMFLPPFCVRRRSAAQPAAPSPALALPQEPELPPQPLLPPARRGSWIPWPEPDQTEAGAAAAGPAAAACSAPQVDNTVPSPLYMLRFILSAPEVAYIAPVAFAAGAGQGFVAGAYMATAVAGTVGPQYVGLVGASFCLASALGAAVWSRLAQRPAFGRRTAFAAAHALLLAWFLAASGLWWASGLEGAGLGSRAALVAALPLPRSSLVALLVCANMLFASVDPVMQAFLQATMQTYYPDKPKLACAVAAPRFVYAIGFSLQQLCAFSLAASLGRPAIAEQCLLQAALVVASGASLWWLHTRVRSVDGAAASPVPGAQAAQQPPQGGQLE
jgi:hypothetical protein